MVTKTTEREIAGWVSQQINEIISKGGYPFSESTIETSVSGIKTRFPDIVIWYNREAKDAFALIELKAPGGEEDKDRLNTVCTDSGAAYAMTWDFNRAQLYHQDQKLVLKKEYPTYALYTLDDWLNAQKKILLRRHLQNFLDDLFELHRHGHLHKFDPDKYFFISLLQEITESLHLYFVQHLRKKRQEKQFRGMIDEFLVEQGIPDIDTDEANRLVGRQWVYGLVTRILFYLTLRKEFSDLPDILEMSKKGGMIGDLIFHAFAEAARHDWQAVFEPDTRIEKIGIPKECEGVLAELLERLGQYRFDRLKGDVIGEIFEELIPENQKHQLGQYFTREDLVDLILGFVIKSPAGSYCDPTCGSGTFLNRIYARIQWLSRGQRRHHEILGQVWGFDISKFPASLATINLFRQDISNLRNFPHVLVRDFFDVRPRQKFRFPPQGGSDQFEKTDVVLPEFTGMVGNFPFIRQEQIEKKIVRYRHKVIHRLALDWFFEQPDLFKTKSNGSEKNEMTGYKAEKLSKTIDELIDRKALDIKLSGQADIYAYLFLHAAKFLEEDGRMGFITSNSYLDVGYGYELKRFFLNRFKVVAIVASWAEPWFDFAAVNTVFTILEKCDNAAERDTNVVRFVKLKRKLADLIPYPDLEMEDDKRWNQIDSLVRRIELSKPPDEFENSSLASSENEDFRVRFVLQERLRTELDVLEEHAKWGKYLRAPNIYFDILTKAKDYLTPLGQVAEIRFGIKTGINDFFYLEPTGLKAEKKDCLHVKNGFNWDGEIEKQFLKKVIISPKEADNIIIDPKKLKNRLFVCNSSKAELKRAGHLGALHYIEWGERQKTKGHGIRLPEVASVKGRAYWWSIEEARTPDFLLNRFIDRRFYFPLMPAGCLVGDTFFVGYFSVQDEDINIALLNSALYALFVEIHGRANMGDGVLTFYGPDINSTLIVDGTKLDQKSREEILSAFKGFVSRSIEDISSEKALRNRKEFDAAILNAVGLEPKVYLPLLHKGLSELVKERLSLPKMRKKVPKVKLEFSLNAIKRQVEEEILKDGLRLFPDAFQPPVRPGDFTYFAISGKLMKIGAHFFGQYEIVDEDGSKIYTANSLHAAHYIVCSLQPDTYRLGLPKNDAIVVKAVKSYERYIKTTYQKLLKRAFSATHDHDKAEKIAFEILRENGYAGDFELTAE